MARQRVVLWVGERENGDLDIPIVAEGAFEVLSASTFCRRLLLPTSTFDGTGNSSAASCLVGEGENGDLDVPIVTKGARTDPFHSLL